jgi:2-keto-3-deoxy-L-rhamnonate aldolase RhmA
MISPNGVLRKLRDRQTVFGPLINFVPHEILRFLDIGAMGVQVPQLNSAADAKATANAVRFPPLGTRVIKSTARSWMGYFFPALYELPGS